MRVWIKAFLILSVLILSAVLVWNIGSVALNMLDAWQGETGEPDPMFAQEPERVTRKPETTTDTRTFQDNSANWNIPNHTPIDLLETEDASEAN